MAAKAITTVGPNATVLRLGSASQSRPSILSQKGAQDKPTLVSKPAAMNTVKSPWAALPPVDKTPPVSINPPTQGIQPRFAQKDPHGFDALVPQQSHAKEIAADDFSRFLRDSQSTNPRELFNSQSGRYEPVAETRRSSVRKESNFRAPAVLQRPSHGDSMIPAEPSAAFQASRSGHQEPSWSRRRASSNLSGESGNFARRFSLGKGLEITRISGDARQRRDSQNEASPPTPGLSSVQSQGQSITSQSPILPQTGSGQASMTSSPRPGHVQPVEASPAVTSVPPIDAVAAQKILMREKREAAIRRKKEEEAREEAAKKERIRQKLETLGMTDEKLGRKPTQDRPQESAASSTDVKPSLVTAPQSPPKPPVPSATGQPQQYGLMKVHAAQPVNGLPQANMPESKSPQLTVQEIQPKVNEIEKLSPRVNGSSHLKTVELYSATSPRLRHQITAADSSTPPTWPEVQQGPTAYPTWHTNGMTTHSAPGGNLWGSPSNHRALGNGDFQQTVQRPQVRQSGYPQNVLPPPPQPIGPPKSSPQATTSPAISKALEASQQPIREEVQTIPAFPSTEIVHPPGSRQGLQQPSFATNSQLYTEQPPSQTGLAGRPGPPEGKKAGVAAWTDFSQHVGQYDAEQNERIRREVESTRAKADRLNLTSDPTFNETWRQVERSEELGMRHVVGVTKTNHRPQLPAMPDHGMADPHRVINGPQGNSQVRSRYQDIFEQSQRPHARPLLPRSTSPSAPPPDSTEHPAFFRISSRPLVKLPGIKDKPIVRLPPTHAGNQVRESPPSAAPAAMPQAVLAQASTLQVSPPSLTRGASNSQPSNKAWQAHFNKLLKDQPSADVSEFSSSKLPLDVSIATHSAAVALPPQEEHHPSQVTWRSSQHGKTAEEEDALFEERDFGSVPTVRIPTQLSLRPRNFRGKSLEGRHRLLSEAEVTSSETYPPLVTDNQRVHGLLVTVFLPGMAASKMKSMPKMPLLSGPRHHYGSRGKPRNGHKSREVSSTHPASKPNSHIVPPPLATGGPNQHPKPKGTPHNPTWARRVSGVAQ